jgi:hypothetical protein
MHDEDFLLLFGIVAVFAIFIVAAIVLSCRGVRRVREIEAEEALTPKKCGKCTIKFKQPEKNCNSCEVSQQHQFSGIEPHHPSPSEPQQFLTPKVRTIIYDVEEKSVHFEDLQVADEEDALTKTHDVGLSFDENEDSFRYILTDSNPLSSRSPDEVSLDYATTVPFSIKLCSDGGYYIKKSPNSGWKFHKYLNFFGTKIGHRDGYFVINGEETDNLTYDYEGITNEIAIIARYG